MMYNVLVSGKHVPDEILPFLARVFEVPPDRVSVRDEDDEDSWDWDHISQSLVTCEYRRMRGDLAWCLTLYAVDGDVPEQPSEAELSLRLSREFDTVTLFPEGTEVPSVFRLVTQDGRFMLARIKETDDVDIVDDEVEEVSAPVPELPHAVVARFEDEVMYVPLPNPVTDQYLPDTREHRLCARSAMTSPSGSV
jgi:hypothetical protein